MRNSNNIGLNTEGAQLLAKELNALLANFQLYYQNLRGFHWNIKGKHFFELHAKFEELYTDTNEKVDQIAERILTLGETPLHSFTDYLNVSEIKEAKNLFEGEETIETTLNNLAILLQIERSALKAAAELDDEGTVSLLSDYISEQEKTVWMLSAWLNKAA